METKSSRRIEKEKLEKLKITCSASNWAFSPVMDFYRLFTGDGGPLRHARHAKTARKMSEKIHYQIYIIGINL